MSQLARKPLEIGGTRGTYYDWSIRGTYAIDDLTINPLSRSQFTWRRS